MTACRALPSTDIKDGSSPAGPAQPCLGLRSPLLGVHSTQPCRMMLAAATPGVCPNNKPHDEGLIIWGLKGKDRVLQAEEVAKVQKCGSGKHHLSSL